MKSKKSLMMVLINSVFFLYVVSASSFAYIEGKKFLSSAFVYVLFAIGIFYVIVNKRIHFDMYGVFKILLCIDVVVMSFAMQNEEAEATIRWVATANLLCITTGAFVYDEPKMIRLLWWGNIVGALIITIETVKAYGGVGAIILYTNSEKQARIGRLITNANTLGFILSNAFLCCMVILLNKDVKVKIVKILMLVMMVIFGVMSFLTGSRKAIIFILFCIIVTTYYYMRNFTLKRKLLVVFSIIAVLFIAIKAIQELPVFYTVRVRMEDLFNAFGENGMVTDSDSNRINMIEEGLNAFLESPLFGKGTAYSSELFGSYAHNNFIELLMNYGLIGFLLYYVPYFFVIPKVARLAKKGDVSAIYFLTFIMLDLILGVGNVYYYNRIVQLTIALAYKYALKMNDIKSNCAKNCGEMKKAHVSIGGGNE